jgi:adenine-specific DNA-methyltransferase
MATGTPRSPQKIVTRAINEIAKVELTYPGKRPLSELLKANPGDFHTVTTGNQNKRLYFAENLSALASLVSDESVCGNVRLVYIDPPYATQTVFHSRKLVHAYEDVFETAEYIEFLRERLVYLHRILADDGSIYLHIDDKMLFHAKIVMDEIFGADNYRNCITRKKCNPKNYTRKTFGNVADYILFYSKSSKYVWNRLVEPWTTESAREYQYVEEGTGRRFMKVPVHAPGIRNGETGKPWREKLPPPGKHWQYPPATLDELDANGEIFWSSNGNPRRKVYIDQSGGTSIQDIWTEFRDAHNQNVHITGYPTEKNIELIKRIIEASSNPGDMVLDCFAGSGTTLMAADMMNRTWIGIDNSPEALRTMLYRFVHGTEPMGDFVGKKNTQRDASTPTLFEVNSGDIDTPVSRNGGLAIQDFTLLTTSDKAHHVSEVARNIGQR